MDSDRDVQRDTDESFDPLEMVVGESAAPLRAYAWFHAYYSLVVIVLIATGLPIQLPDLRAQIFGGYGRLLAAVHEWAGIVMLALPCAAFALHPSRVVETVRIRSYRRESLRFHAINLWFTIASGVVFIATGFVLWFQDRLPDRLVDISMELHLLFSYVLYVSIPIHVFTARHRIVHVVLAWWHARGSRRARGRC